MKKCLSLISLLLVFISSFVFIPQSTSFASEKDAKVIVSRCYLYTEDNFISDKVTYIDGENTVLVVLKHGDIVKTGEENGDFVYVTTENNNEGYIYKYYISSTASQVVYPVFNASVRKETTIYDIDKTATEHIAKKGQRVYIYEGFDDKKEYTAVQVVLEDQTLYNGYIKTSEINPDGVSGLLIIAISIIIAGVTIILSIIFIKKKKSKN